MKSKKHKNEELRFFFQNQKNLFGSVCGWGAFCFVFRISINHKEAKEQKWVQSPYKNV